MGPGTAAGTNVPVTVNELASRSSILVTLSVTGVVVMSGKKSITRATVLFATNMLPTFTLRVPALAGVKVVGRKGPVTVMPKTDVDVGTSDGSTVKLPVRVSVAPIGPVNVTVTPTRS